MTALALRIKDFIEAQPAPVSLTQLFEMAKDKYPVSYMHEAITQLHKYNALSVKVRDNENWYSKKTLSVSRPMPARYRPSPTLQAEMDAYHALHPWWWPWPEMEHTWDDLFKTPEELRVEAWNRERELVKQLS